MIVRFGLDLDGMRPERGQTRIGFAVAGPAAFLSILETQLGIFSDDVLEGERIVRYRASLEEADSPERFYHRSFAVDELGVARMLLRWRDTWRMAGWDGAFAENACRRLQDMATVEQLSSGKISPSFGERLAAVARSLETQRTQVEAVELVDLPEDLPFLWKQVLGNFTVNQLNCDSQAPCGEPNTDLRKLQSALCSEKTMEGDNTSKLELSGDGSVERYDTINVLSNSCH